MEKLEMMSEDGFYFNVTLEQMKQGDWELLIEDGSGSCSIILTQTKMQKLLSSLLEVIILFTGSHKS
jgi:uncharacterized cysteine cluster protein YcgN (CxxCxxCC family)